MYALFPYLKVFAELFPTSDPLEALALSFSKQPNEYASSDFSLLGYKASPEAFGSMSDYEQRTL